jgi:hypothetical protein
MAKVGRNDPCYCGSGKKYKHCHWQAEQDAQRSRLNTRRARQSLFSRLVDFAQRPRFEPDYKAAFDLFWDNRRKAGEKNALDAMEILRFYEWYLVDYHTSQDRQRLVDMFRAQAAGYITPEERGYLGAWQSAQFSVFEVSEVLGVNGVHIVDLLREEAHDVVDESFTSAMKPGELYMARLVKRENAVEFLLSVSQVPIEEKDKLLEFAREKYRLYAEAHFSAQMSDFLRESAYLFNHFLLNLRGETPISEAKVVLPTRAEIEKTAATMSVMAPQAQPN